MPAKIMLQCPICKRRHKFTKLGQKYWCDKSSTALTKRQLKKVSSAATIAALKYK